MGKSHEQNWLDGRLEMSIVEAVLGLCRKSWICHSCGPQDTCSGSVSRGAETLAHLVECAPKPHVVVDMDSIPCLRHEGRCDFLYFSDDRMRKKQWFVPVEVSHGKHKKAEGVLRQLQLGVDLVEKWLKYPGRVEVIPLFVGRSKDAKKVRRMAILYRGQRAKIEVVERNGRIYDKME